MFIIYSFLKSFKEKRQCLKLSMKSLKRSVS